MGDGQEGGSGGAGRRRGEPLPEADGTVSHTLLSGPVTLGGPRHKLETGKIRVTRDLHKS